jgi:hypothetical protein
MGTGIDHGADLEQVCLHGMGVAVRHDQAGALALGRADRAEDVGPFGALVVCGPRPGSASGPSAGDLVLLADTGFILPPQFYLDPGRERGADFFQFGREAFLKSSIARSFWA